MLQLHHLSAGYGASHVIHEVSLEARPGEIVCLLGPNGAGKSTVLKAIAKLATVHSGRVEFCGRDITSLQTHELLKLGIAFVPQGRINFPSMTVQENLEMGGFLLTHAATLRENIEATLSTFSVLRPKLQEKAASLSGGEGQVLAIARALVMRPSLLLLDEPSLGLAPRAVAEIFQSLHRLVATGMTILLVEQNVHLALEIANRGYLLAAGKIVFHGSAEELGDPERMRGLYLG